VARSLAATPATKRHALLTRGGCAAWRVARAATGRLRAHPYARYQKEAGVSVLLMNGLVAAVAALGASRQSALKRFDANLKRLARELDDARALTRAADLSDSLGRSQLEVRSLLGALADETGSPGTASHPAPPPATQARSDASGYGSAAAAADWPYLGF
jgi:hypothetical protein